MKKETKTPSYMKIKRPVSNGNHSKKSDEKAQDALIFDRIILSRKFEDFNTLQSDIQQYLNSLTDYSDAPVHILAIIAELMLRQNESRKFLDISLWLINNHIQHELSRIGDSQKIAQLYYNLARELENSNEITAATACLNISFILTGNSKYSDAAKAYTQYNDTASLYNDTASLSAPNEKDDSNTSIKGEVANCSINPATQFYTGFKEIIITPGVISPNTPIFLQGTFSPQRRATGFRTYLKCQILYIKGPEQKNLLFITADIFGFSSHMVEMIKKEALKIGVSPEAIILNASHTQHAPGTMPHIHSDLGVYNGQYCTSLTSMICNTLGTIDQNCEESYIYWGKPDGSSLPFALIKQKTSQKQIIMANQSWQFNSSLLEGNISADFPGYFKEALINSGKADYVMFLTAASGYTENRKDDGRGEQLSDTRIKARRAAQKIISTLDSSRLTALNKFDIVLENKQIYIPLQEIPCINNINELKNNSETLPVIKDWASRITTAYPDGNFPNALALNIQLIIINNEISLIILPAAFFPSLEQCIENTVSHFFTSTFMLGCTNGLICYIPDDGRIEQKDYSASLLPYYFMIPYHLAKGAEEKIASEIKKSLLKLMTKLDGSNR